MRQHRLSLCRDHFLEWMPEQTLLQIKKFRMLLPGERLLVAVSGGKDSLALWDILHSLGIPADGLYINLGIEGQMNYSAASDSLAAGFASGRGLTLHTVDIEQEYGKSIPRIVGESSYSRQKPCSVCGIVKRHIMNSFASKNGYDILATGHNLDDEASVLFSNTLTWSLEKINRQYPVLPASAGMVKKIKPLNHFYERETTAYALLRGIDYMLEECLFATGNLTNANKEVLNRLENERAGAKMIFYTSFLKARKGGLLQLPAEPGEPAAEIIQCPGCGRPTTNRKLCSFCRLFAAGE
jgi:uncharacterized protein (TIGR00269 family)